MPEFSRVAASILFLTGVALAPFCLPGTAESAETWSISSASVLPEGKPSNPYIQDLLLELENPEGEGAAISAEEFGLYCDKADPRVDADALRRYAVPGSIKRQHMDHAHYRRILMRDGRLRAGAAFLRDHDELLRRAQSRYGVARQDIVAILMWESGLGKITGDTPVFNVLLAQLLYLEEARRAESELPPRERKRFEKLKGRAVVNLTALLRLSKAKGQDPTIQRGSWAGAIGYPQFMPASLKYATDGDDDGLIDLNHWPDVIFSVANYLREHGYDMSYRGRKRGIHRYNPIDSYVHGVIAYADAIVGL
jgi:membrane-bound lytic murein transglycosylase B